MFQDDESEVFYRNAFLHIGRFLRLEDQLVIPKAQGVGRREKERAFEHGGQCLKVISPVTLSVKS